MANKVRTSQQQQHRGLAEDLRPLVFLLRLVGHFMPEWGAGKRAGRTALRSLYSLTHLLLGTAHFVSLVARLLLQFSDTTALVSNTLAMLFFLHGVTKVTYFAVKRKQFYRTMLVWQTSHSHPLFVESDSRHRTLGEREMQRLLRAVMLATVATTLLWATQPFLATGVSPSVQPPNSSLLLQANNESAEQQQPHRMGLMINAWYPWDPYGSAFTYVVTYLLQLYWLAFCICQVNLLDTLFCSWLIYACEQLKHLKEGMQGLMQLSAHEAYPAEHSFAHAADSADGLSDGDGGSGFLRPRKRVFPGAAEAAAAAAAGGGRVHYAVPPELLGFRTPAAAIEPSQGGEELLRQDMVVRSAIKYWVERHKHILRFVESIGDTYGMALLLHMLTSTVTLTLLSYEATKISGANLYAFTVVGYLCYTLGQVFLFCVFGNRLIEESVSVMHAAYSCPWYDGSEEAKTFVQIVCQQCQRPMSVSGAKFFTVSLDLFASVLGAVVTYFMVLIQLN